VENSGGSDRTDSALGLKEVFKVLWAARLWIGGFTAITTVGCVLWALLATPIYRSTVVLAPVTVDRSAAGLSSALGQFGGLASLAGISLDGRDSRLEESLAVLRSREFIEKFVADHKLLPLFFPEKWSAESQNWIVTGKRIPTPWKGYKFFSQTVMNIDRDKKTGLVAVSVDWKVREDASSWANELIDRTNEEMRLRALAAAQLSTKYLEQELQDTQLVETRAAINRLIESEIRQKMLASVTKEYVFRVVDRALPADVSDVFRPKKVMLILLGLIGGLVVGSIGALVRFSIRSA
jgi:uncharacterized protein involved in exopolysaccharide biosynthesis